MKTGDTVYVRYIGNIPHWPEGLLPVPITSVGGNYIALAINGGQCRFSTANVQPSHSS